VYKQAIERKAVKKGNHIHKDQIAEKMW